MEGTSHSEHGQVLDVASLCQEVLGQRRLIVASNRGPVEYQLAPDGQPQVRRGSGGVVTALAALTRLSQLSWVASALGEGDRRMAQESQGRGTPSPLPGHKLSLRFVVTPRRTYHKYYNIFCNPLLWFLQHYIWSAPYTPNVDNVVLDAWADGYIPVNLAFADSILAEAASHEPAPVVMLHDYHLYLTGGYVRERLPDAVIQHMIYIPWPAPSYWQLLPRAIRLAILEGLCANDIVGFQSRRDVASFLESCEALLPGAQVDHGTSAVRYGGRSTRVVAYPLSIDVGELKRMASSPRISDYERKLAPLLVEKTLVRVDRMEPSKNIVRGFRAYGLLLERHPELRRRVKFLAFLVPSRAHIKQYERYMEEVDEQVKRINADLGQEGWQPVHVFYENNYSQAMAALRLYDVLLANSVIDGTNQVAKEGPIVNTKHGVLVLSEASGVSEELRSGALSVAPADLEGTMEALYEALTMPAEERQRLSGVLQGIVQEKDVNAWIRNQFLDLKPLLG